MEAVPSRRRIAALSASAALLALSAFAGSAHAVPSFARQTGVPCSACHVGAFGPHLTDYGTQFKLLGYTLSNGSSESLPLSGMVIASNSRTQKGQPDPLPDHVKANNNTNLDQASVFLAGKLSDHVGVFSQLTYDGIGRSLAVDEVDLRYARAMSLGDHSVIGGLSLNNAPGSTDPYNALPFWGYPFVSSGVVPTPGAATLLEGALNQRVLGVNGYAQLDGSWYGEIGSYRTLSATAQSRLGLGRDGDPGPLHGAIYARLAAHGAWGDHSLSGGVLAFSTDLQPDRGVAQSNHFDDRGIDISYRWAFSDRAQFSLLGSTIRETQRLDAGVAAGGAANGHDTLSSDSLAGAIQWDLTWGLTLQRFSVHGSSDNLLYADGFASGSPNSSGSRLQLDWTPFGKQPLRSGFDPQWRLGLQYTRYNSFNGAKLNYAGDGRNAADNNSLFAFAWLMF